MSFFHHFLFPRESSALLSNLLHPSSSSCNCWQTSCYWFLTSCFDGPDVGDPNSNRSELKWYKIAKKEERRNVVERERERETEKKQQQQQNNNRNEYPVETVGRWIRTKYDNVCCNRKKMKREIIRRQLIGKENDGHWMRGVWWRLSTVSYQLALATDNYHFWESTIRWNVLQTDLETVCRIEDMLLRGLARDLPSNKQSNRGETMWFILINDRNDSNFCYWWDPDSTLHYIWRLWTGLSLLPLDWCSNRDS